MTDDIFELARSLINESTIKKYFRSEDSYETNREYFVKSPLRRDNHAGSFCINLDTGLYVDNARPSVKGDFIDLVAKTYNISLKEAAEKIISENSGIQLPDKKAKSKKEKVSANLNIPEKAFEELPNHLNHEFILSKHGQAVKAWKYIANGRVWCVVVRHELNEKKTIKPYYYGVDNKWHSGNPLENNIPLFNIDKVENDLPIVIVEGEKCASIEIEGYNVATWIGGSSQISKSDWTCLNGRDVYFWADNDIPGYKCAKQLKEKYPHIKIIDSSGKPEKWDIADAKEEGIDLKKYIEEAKEYDCSNNRASDDNSNNNISDNVSDKSRRSNINDYDIDSAPFKFLGYEESKHYFIPDGFDIVRKFSAGSLTKSKLLELAPLSWWAFNFEKPTKNPTIDWDSAVDWVIQSSMRAGMYNNDLIRGAGFWYEDGKIIVNDGFKTVDEKGQAVKVKSDNHYVKSSRRVDNCSGRVATEEEGKDLVNLFKAQNFESNYAACCALGWTLIAPFCGLLDWRPHIWITGAQSSGKSFLFEKIIAPLVGQFRYDGSGKNTAASFYKSLRSDSCPAILDEMEVHKSGNKDSSDNIREIVEIARNASSNFSAKRTICDNDGGVATYTFKTACCFASIVPFLEGAAIESRFILCRLISTDAESELTKRKYRITEQYLENGLLDDCGIYRRKILQNYEKLKSLSKKFCKSLKENGIGARDAENLSPIFSAVCILTDIDEQEAIDAYVSLACENILKQKMHEEKDEEKFMRNLFEYKLFDDDRNQISVSEVILDCQNEQSARVSMQSLLARSGMKFFNHKGVKCLAIAQKSNSIEQIMNNTGFSSNYKEILRRHSSVECETWTVNINGLSKRCILLNWEKIKNEYFVVDKKEDVSSSIVDEVL